MTQPFERGSAAEGAGRPAVAAEAGARGRVDASQARRTSAASRSVKLRRLVWAGVEMTFFRGSFHTMNGWRAMLLRLFGARVGRKCIIRRTVRVYYPWNLSVGDGCILGDEAEVYCLGRITIGHGAMVSQQAYLCAGTHDYRDPALPLLTPPIAIGAEAWICARAFIGPGVVVGEGAVVAAGAVVVKDVRAWMIVGGNPAREVKMRILNDER